MLGVTAALAAAGWVAGLECLELLGTDLGAPTASAALAAAPLSCLTRLELADTAILHAPSAAALVGTLASGSSLRELSVEFIASAGPAALAALAAARLPALTQLRLTAMGVSRADAVRMLARARWPCWLEELSLTVAALGGPGFALLADADLPRLRRLQVWCQDVSAAGLRALGRAAWLPGLELLQIGGAVEAPCVQLVAERAECEAVVQRGPLAAVGRCCGTVDISGLKAH